MILIHNDDHDYDDQINCKQELYFINEKSSLDLMSMDILNDDILIRIFDFLNLEDKIRLRRTSKRWKLLLDYQLNKLRALRIGHFDIGGFQITSGLELKNCYHMNKNHRQETGTIFDDKILEFPIDLDTKCFNIKRFDHLNRYIQFCSNNITMLSLGKINVTYRLLNALMNNLNKLEHLELIGCASSLNEYIREGEGRGRRRTNSLNFKSSSNDNIDIIDNIRASYHHHHPSSSSNSYTSRNCSAYYSLSNNDNDNEASIPSLQSFNDPQYEAIHSNSIYNQHNDEQLNMNERLLRANQVKMCSLYKNSKEYKYWPNLRHLLLKDCNFLNEFSLSLIIAITSSNLKHLEIESNQNLTGEFLNYCGTNLNILSLKHCPSIQVRFFENFIKIKKILYPNATPSIFKNRKDFMSSVLDLPSLSSNNFAQEVYCTL